MNLEMMKHPYFQRIKEAIMEELKVRAEELGSISIIKYRPDLGVDELSEIVNSPRLNNRHDFRYIVDLSIIDGKLRKDVFQLACQSADTERVFNYINSREDLKQMFLNLQISEKNFIMKVSHRFIHLYVMDNKENYVYYHDILKELWLYYTVEGVSEFVYDKTIHNIVNTIPLVRLSTPSSLGDIIKKFIIIAYKRDRIIRPKTLISLYERYHEFSNFIDYDILSLYSDGDKEFINKRKDEIDYV